MGDRVGVTEKGDLQKYKIKNKIKNETNQQISALSHYLLYHMGKSVIKQSDMSEEMLAAAITVASSALEQFSVESDAARFIKEEFDKRFSPDWQVIVGPSFGSWISYQTGHFAYFYLDSTAVLLFKAA